MLPVPLALPPSVRHRTPEAARRRARVRPRLRGRRAAALPILSWALATVVLAAGAASAQTAATEPPAPQPPGPFEISPRLLELTGAAAAVRADAADRADLGPLAGDLDAVREQQERLAADLEATLGAEPRGDRLSAAAARLARQRLAVDRLMDEVSARLAEIESERAAWVERREFWRSWEQQLADDPRAADHRSDFRRAGRLIAGVLDDLGTASEPLLEVQRELGGFQRTNLGLRARIGELQAERRRRLLSADAPPLGSAAWRRELAAAPGEVPAGVRRALAIDPGFLRRHLWLVLLQVAVALATGFVARHLRSRGERDERWRILLGHPWAIGVFVAASTLSFLYAPPPPLWELAIWALIGGSASVLAAGMFRYRPKRLVVYAAAALAVGFFALRTIELPGALLRPLLAIAAAAGALGLALLAGRRPEPGRPRLGFRVSVALAAAVLATVVLLQLVGYDSLARWLFDAGAITALVGYVITFLVRLGRGALRALLDGPAAARLPALARVGPELAHRLSGLLALVLIAGGALYGLTVWELYDTPGEAWRDLVARGVTVGEARITLGALLLAVAAIYAALQVSWAVRALLDDAVLERRQLDRGVGNTVKTLLHYLVVTLGLLVALAFLGVDLSSLAIVAGAFGIGIGFGLQDLAGNFVSGLVLLFERPVRVGDVVVIDGDWGTVSRIGLRSTVVTTFDRAEIIVPNADLVSKKVTNWTLSDVTARVIVPIGVAYGSDPVQVLEILREVADGHPEALAEPEPMVLFVGFGDSSLDFELRVWIRDIQRRLATATDLRVTLERRLREAGIQIPFPQRDLHLRSVAPAAGRGLAGSTPRSGSRLESPPPDPATGDGGEANDAEATDG